MKGIEDIKRILPIRYPFLLVDRIIELNQDKIVALKNVTVNEPFFCGHFPQEAVMPGTLILEGMAQTAGLLLLEKEGAFDLKFGYLIGIDEARFRRKVIPGDQLIFEAKILRQKGGLYKLEAKAKVEQDLAAEAVISLKVTKRLKSPSDEYLF